MKPSERRPVPLRLTRLLYGGDYNPDQWPEAVQVEDARLMPLANWNIATLPVFSWAHLNPALGSYTFDWLDRVIERLTNAGIRLCLATATASTPAWLAEKYPDVLTTDEQGRRRPHGNRHAFCPNSPSYRRLGGALVRELAQRYGKLPGLELWHVNNEYGGNWPNYCYCPRCALAFRTFLERRHGNIEGLNAAWSTAFWGHTFTSFTQIDPPFAHGEGSIQALKLDWRRFQSNSYLDCFRHEAAILRELTPDIPITTNLMGAFTALNYHEWAKELDVVSWDNYPRFDTPFADVAFAHALHRGMRGGAPFLLLEQSPSHQNWAPHCRLKPPGQLALQSYQAIAHGAESVMYFQWRKSKGGIEKLHGAVVEHHGRSDARVFREVSELGRELAALGDKTLHGRTPARVAVLFDWEAWWALGASSGPSRELDYHREVVRHYAALHTSGIETDVIPPDADLSRYDVIVLSTACMLRAEQARALVERVRDGATLVATFFTGMVDEHDRIHDGGAPGPLREVLGVSVEEYDAFPPELAQGVRFARPFGELAAAKEYPASILCERLWLEAAVPLASYTREFYAGDAAITVNQFGKGRAYYLGTRLDEAGLGGFLRAVCAELDVRSPLAAGAVPPTGVEVTRRVALVPHAAPGKPAERTVLYLLNHGDARQDVALPAGRYLELRSGKLLEGTIALQPRAALVLERQTAPVP